MRRLSLLITLSVLILAGCKTDKSTDNKINNQDVIKELATMTPEPTIEPTPIPTEEPTPSPVPVIEITKSIIADEAYKSDANLKKGTNENGYSTYSGDGLVIIEDIDRNIRETYIDSKIYTVYGIQVGMTKKELKKYIQSNLPDYCDAGTSGSDMDYLKWENQGFTFTIEDDKLVEILYFEPIDSSIGLEGEAELNSDEGENTDINTETDSNKETPVSESDIYTAALSFLNEAIADNITLADYVACSYEVIGKGEAGKGYGVEYYATFGIRFTGEIQEYTIKVNMEYSEIRNEFKYSESRVTTGF